MNSRLVQNSSSSVVSQLGHMCTHIPLVRGTILSQSTAQNIHIRNSHAHAHALPTARPPLTQREVDIATGRVLREARLEARHFGEGTTVFNGKVSGLIALHVIPLVFLFVLNPTLDGKVLGFAFPFASFCNKRRLNRQGPSRHRRRRCHCRRRTLPPPTLPLQPHPRRQGPPPPPPPPPPPRLLPPPKPKPHPQPQPQPRPASSADADVRRPFP